jgi:hypothetical protein
MKKIKYTFICALLASSMAYAQQEGEQAGATGDIVLGGFPGCTVAPPKNSCDARIKCAGVGRIFGNSGRSVQAATKEASMNARNELARFYSTKQKAKEALANASEASATTNADGSETVKESFSRMQAEISSSSAEALLSGVVVLGRDIDKGEKTVTITVGVSCQSQAAARKSQLKAAESEMPGANGSASNGGGAVQTDKGSAEGFKEGPMNIQSVRQRVKNADDF